MNEYAKQKLKLAKKGDAAAQFHLANCYYVGVDVKENERKAAKWYRKSAEQNYADAQFKLGVCYNYGQGVKKDYKQAYEWYKKAYGNGCEEAKEYMECVEKIIRHLASFGEV